MKLKACRLAIRIKKSDQVRGKSIEKILVKMLMENKIGGATVWLGIDGFGKRRSAVCSVEGIPFDCPVIIEVIEEKARLEPLLADIRQIVGDDGMITLHEVEII